MTSESEDRLLLREALEVLEDSRDAVWQEYHSSWMHHAPTRQGQLAAMLNQAEAHDAVITKLKKRLGLN